MGRVRWLAGVMFLTGAMVLCAGAWAIAEEPLTRAEYVPLLEGICKPRSEATRKAMEGVRDDVRDPHRVGIAAQKFAHAATIFGGTVKLISRVPRPPADMARLKEW